MQTAAVRQTQDKAKIKQKANRIAVKASKISLDLEIIIILLIILIIRSRRSRMLVVVVTTILSCDRVTIDGFGSVIGFIEQLQICH
jgi:hypothetical protein